MSDVLLGMASLCCVVALWGLYMAPSPAKGVLAPSAIDLAKLLSAENGFARTSAPIDRFLVPIDARETQYNDLRADAYRLTDADILLRYREGVQRAMQYKRAFEGRSVPSHLAQDHLMELHALWREAQQRGLAPRLSSMPFDEVWLRLRTHERGMLSPNWL